MASKRDRYCIFKLGMLILLPFYSYSCTFQQNQASASILVLNYRDFGPQVIAYHLLGNEWWQWNSHGDSQPKRYPIKVVVYRELSLESVKARYAVKPDRKLDYRYVSYQKAISYLNKNISENVLPGVTAKLRRTRLEIVRVLGASGC